MGFEVMYLLSFNDESEPLNGDDNEDELLEGFDVRFFKLSSSIRIIKTSIKIWVSDFKLLAKDRFI